MKLATWNVNSLKVRLPHVLDWLAATQADVLRLQETKMEDKAFPHAELEAAGLIDEEAKKNLPPADLLAEVSFLTAAQVEAANALLQENWGPMVADAG